MDKQIILGLAFFSFMAVGSCPAQPLNDESLKAQFVEEQREPATGVPRSDLVVSIVTWLSADFALPENYQHPRIEIISSMKMAAVRYRGLGAGLQARVLSDEQWLEKMRDTVALYEDNSRTIFLREGWTGATPAEMSVLVHEMVHHLQNLAGEKFECAQAREKPAYTAQKNGSSRPDLIFSESSN